MQNSMMTEARAQTWAHLVLVEEVAAKVAQASALCHHTRSDLRTCIKPHLPSRSCRRTCRCQCCYKTRHDLRHDMLHGKHICFDSPVAPNPRKSVVTKLTPSDRTLHATRAACCLPYSIRLQISSPCLLRLQSCVCAPNPRCSAVSRQSCRANHL